jgi:hypothetical protein
VTAPGGGGIGPLIALVAIGGSAAVAYAAGSRESPAPTQRTAHAERPPKPRITVQPKTPTTSIGARFAFTDRQPGVRFECRLDLARWRNCSSPLTAKVASGRHTFSVRAVTRRGRRSAAARVRWTRLEPKDFSIVADLSRLSALYPGAPPIALPLTIENPNSRPILVTDLRIAVVADPAGCASEENLSLGQSNASSATPLTVPSGGSVRLPTQGIEPPTIQLRNLEVNQDACQGARFPLEFTGSAHG